MMSKNKIKIEELNENETYTSWLTLEEDERFILNTERSIGYEEGKIEVAKSLLEQNIDINVIVKATGLSIEEIKDLKKEI